MKKNSKLENMSDRIFLRRYLKTDRNGFVRLNTDPEVRKYMNGALDANKASEVFERVMGEEFTFAVIEKDSGDFIGHIFISATESPEEGELGFMFFKKFWGRGFATEACSALISTSLEDAKFSSLVATIDVGHEPSLKVIKKLCLRI